MSLTLTIKSCAVMGALNDLIERGQDMEPVLHAIDQELESRNRARFESKTDPAIPGRHGSPAPAPAPC